MTTEEILTDEKYKKMLLKLDDMYKREEELQIEFTQLQEDKELLQTMIMYQYNKDHIIKKNNISDILNKPKKNL